MTGFTAVSKTVTRQVTRFTTVANTVSKKTSGLAHMHVAPSDDSCVFVRTDSAPLSDSYGLLHTGCKRFIDHAAAADARKSCVTGRHPSCAAVITVSQLSFAIHRHLSLRPPAHAGSHSQVAGA